MPCPFLKETRVKYCQSASVRKMIPLASSGCADEKCASPDHASCTVYRAQNGAAEAGPVCPYLQESLMQYCGAAPVAKFVPYSESLLSRCGNNSHRYCELYLGLARPQEAPEEVDGLPVPGWLDYSRNHMWLDLTDDGVCHVGIDAFLARALGKVDRISYVGSKGARRPMAVVTTGNCDLQILFPNAMMVTGCNLYLRADPARLTADPFVGGWLFEGTPLPETTESLLGAATAPGWMAQEVRRANEFLQQEVVSAHAGAVGALAADGGMFAEGLAQHLDREQLLGFFEEFFAPDISRTVKREP